MKTVLVINGHPDKDSFCAALAKRYFEGASTTGSICTLVHLSDLTFEPNLAFGYRAITELEPDLLAMQQKIMDADHLVFAYPTWWGTYPALLKAFIDRVFLPGFAFKYKPDSMFWDKLLKGKTARLIVTMDAPAWYYALVYRSAGHVAFKKATLEFCGVKPVTTSTFGSVKSSSDKQRQNWLGNIYAKGMVLN